MNITNAKYINRQDGTQDSISATIDDLPMTIPLDPTNRHYDEIMRQVAAGELTIADPE